MSFVKVGAIALLLVGAYGVRRWWRKREEKQRERAWRKQYGEFGGRE